MSPESPRDAASDPAAPAPAADLARQVLARLRGGGPAGSAPSPPGRPAPSRPRRRAAGEPVFSGSGPDDRDPQPISRSVAALLQARGWQHTLAVGSVMGRWEQIVGRDIAAHCRPERLTDGVLHLVAESTAWATQLRLLSRTITERLDAEVGAGVVRAVRIHGPVTPDWRHGPRRVVGRGPRDTYG